MLTASEILGEVRDLTPSDMDWLKSEGCAESVTALSVVKNRHHRIAQMLALGRKSIEIAAILDMHPNSISRLADSPAMCSLIEEYRQAAFNHDLVVQERLRDTALLGLEKLHVEILTETIKGDDLRKATMDLFDRVGHGKTVIKKETRVNLNGADLHRLKAAAREAEGPVLDLGKAQYSEVPDPSRTQGSEGGRTSVREEGGETPCEVVPLHPARTVD